MQIYIHIPFCVKKCAYCDFLSASQSDETIDAYVEGLIQEIQAHSFERKNPCVTTVFFGGGTPSVLTPEQMEKIFHALREQFHISEEAEITIEVNPGTVTKEKLDMYQKCGVNRLSFGLQSTNNRELKLLGRIHTYEEFLENYSLARACGFGNINIDLISAIPKQTLESWTQTLNDVVKLNPEHISAYSLIVEEDTPFARLYGEGCPNEKDLPSEEEERAIYYKTEEVLNAHGYFKYEISNYAKPEKECRHNLGYWERKEYLGLGLGAASLIENTRFRNTRNLEFYLEHACEPKKLQREKQALSQKEQIEEFLFLGLRKTKGITLEEFERNFGIQAEVYYQEQFEKLLKSKLLEKEGDTIRLTKKGMDVSNYVFAEFIL